MENRLVDYPAYQKHYGGVEVVDNGIKYRSRPPSAMGSFPQHLLTPLGKRVLAESKRFHGRLPKHRGACKAGVYLKWEVRSWDEYHALMVFRDWLLDEGIEVTVTESERKPKVARMYWEEANAKHGGRMVIVPVPPEPEGGNRYLKFDLR